MRDSSGAKSTALAFNGITKRFANFLANDRISLTIGHGEIVALLGENGAGKTTLMNILFGHYRADEGSIEVFGQPLPPGSPKAALKAGIGMVHQHFALAGNLTVLDNLMLGTEPLHHLHSRRAEARRRIQTLADELAFKVDVDARVGDLSVGERQRVEVLKVLYRNARILILDEPTAVLFPDEAKSLFALLRRLAERGRTIIFISHKLHEVLALAHRVVVLRQGKLVADRPVADTSAKELAEHMVGRAIKPTLLPPCAAGQPVLAMKGITLSRRNGTVALDGINLTVHANEIVGVAGVSGNGQSELASVVEGLSAPDSGTLTLFGERVRRFDPAGMIARNVGRIPEDRHQTGVAAALPLWENAILEQYRMPAYSRHGWRRIAAARRAAAQLVRDFDIRCPGESVRTALLSGGNMQKVILGRVMSRSPRFIVASHPTRGLDIGAIEYVHEKIIAARMSGAGILLISDDLDEIMQLSDKVIVIYQGRASQAFDRQELRMQEIGMAMTGGGSRAH